MEIDTQGIKVDEFSELLCDSCLNSPLAYYCPVCDFKACLDCLPKSFRRQRTGALTCKHCGSTDTRLDTFVGEGKV